MRKIFCPTDFSEQANHAVEAGYYLAKKFNAEFHLFHVIESSAHTDFNIQGAPGGETDMEDVFFLKLIKATERRMTELVSTPGLEEIQVTSSIKIGKPIELIREEIESGGYTMIVMGTKGTSGMNEILVGSNAERIVRSAKIPVLTVKKFVDEQTFKSIIYASTFIDNDSELIEQVKMLQEAFDSEVHLLRVNTPNNFITDWSSRKLMKKFAKEHGLSNCTFNVYNDTIEEDGIMYFAEEIQAGLLVMTTHGRTGFSHLLSGSIAEDLVNHSKRPVLTYNTRK